MFVITEPLWWGHGFVMRSKLFPLTTDGHCSPLDAPLGARNGQYGGTFVLPHVDVHAVLLIREVVAVRLPVAAQ